MNKRCQHADDFGRCIQPVVMSAVDGSFRVEKKMGRDGEETHTEHAEYTPGKYCYYHQKVVAGLISKDYPGSPIGG